MQSRHAPVLAAGAVLAPIGLVLSIILFGGGSQAAADICSPTGPGVSVDANQLPQVAIAGYEGEQLKTPPWSSTPANPSACPSAGKRSVS